MPNEIDASIQYRQKSRKEASGFTESTVDILVYSIKAFLPFSRVDLVSRVVDKSSNTILDVGCGGGLPMKAIRGHRSLFAVGVDQSKDFIKRSKQGHIHDQYVLCNARYLPFQEKSFDIILCLEALYALPKKDCLSLIVTFENIARNQLILSERTGAQSEEVDPWGCRIQSTWYIDDFQKMGFKIRGSHGLKIRVLEAVFSRNGLLKYFFSYLTSLPAFLLPQSAQNMLCYKIMPKVVNKT